MEHNQKILDMSKKYLGMCEFPGVERDNPTIVEWLAAVGLKDHGDETGWCAAAINGILRECGLKGTDSPVARTFQGWGKSVRGMEKPGDIIILRRGQGWQAHVGIFIAWAQQKTRVIVRGGNQKDSFTDTIFKAEAVLDVRRAL